MNGIFFIAIAVDITVNINTSRSCIETNKSRGKCKFIYYI